jgi:hypothetical protein
LCLDDAPGKQLLRAADACAGPPDAAAPAAAGATAAARRCCCRRAVFQELLACTSSAAARQNDMLVAAIQLQTLQAIQVGAPYNAGEGPLLWGRGLPAGAGGGS